MKWLWPPLPRTGDPQTPFLPHSQRLLGVAFPPDSRLVATASEDGTARLWDSETGEPKSPPLRHDADVLHVAFRADQTLLDAIAPFIKIRPDDQPNV